MIVVKLGGSLFDQPGFRVLFRSWLEKYHGEVILIVPGGGRFANAVRQYDSVHQLGEETSHWLALQSMVLSAHFLKSLWPDGEIVSMVPTSPGMFILNAHAYFAQHDGVPHSWAVTSDSLAAVVAQRTNATRLILWKSVELQVGLSWGEAAERGFVDDYFPEAVKNATFEIEWVNGNR